MFGGYVSGVSLSGAPAIVPIVAKQVRKESLRSTLFVLWTILVSIKLSAFAITGQSFQIAHQLWLLPAATIGHYLGMQAHNWLQQLPEDTFYHMLGATLLVLSILGMFKIDWQQLWLGIQSLTVYFGF